MLRSLKARLILIAVVVGTVVVPAVSAPTAAEAAGRSCVEKVIAQGTTGSCVKNIQTIINANYLYGVPVDGVFGSSTKSAVVRVQRAESLTADGIVGKNTWSRLCRPNDGGRSNAQIASGCPAPGSF